MPFFTFDQNNSGGNYDEDPERGIGPFVIIEADSVPEVNERAERIGLYFDGEGDCDCCGERWSAVWYSDEGTPTPQVYGQPVAESVKEHGWGDAYIHHADGTIERVTA